MTSVSVWMRRRSPDSCDLVLNFINTQLSIHCIQEFVTLESCSSTIHQGNDYPFLTCKIRYPTNSEYRPYTLTAGTTIPKGKKERESLMFLWNSTSHLQCLRMRGQISQECLKCNIKLFYNIFYAMLYGFHEINYVWLSLEHYYFYSTGMVQHPTACISMQVISRAQNSSKYMHLC